MRILHLALKLVRVGKGDEILVSTLTFSASVNPIILRGADARWALIFEICLICVNHDKNGTLMTLIKADGR